MTWLMIYMLIAYATAQQFQIEFGQIAPATTVMGGTLSFLLIFRANSAYMRYWDGRTSVTMFFTSLRDFLMLSCMYAHSTPEKKHLRCSTPAMNKKIEMLWPDLHDRSSKLRVDFARLVLAYAVVLKMHTRIAYDGYCFGKITGETKWLVDWDRLRLLQLLKDDEFYAMDKCLGIIDADMRSGCSLQELIDQFRGRQGVPSSWPKEFDVQLEPACRTHNVLMYFIREVLFNNVNDAMNSCPWGIKERFVPVLSKLLQTSQWHFELINQIITTPLPLPYACLCKSLLVIFLASLPSMLIDIDVGPFGSLLIPMMVALALLGIDATATELENPFGDDANDLDLMEFVSGLEHEALQMLRLCGDFQGKAAFITRTMPEFVAGGSCKPLISQLAVEEFADEEDVGKHQAGDSYDSSYMSGSGQGSQQASARSDDL